MNARMKIWGNCTPRRRSSPPAFPSAFCILHSPLRVPHETLLPRPRPPPLAPVADARGAPGRARAKRLLGSLGLEARPRSETADRRGVHQEDQGIHHRDVLPLAPRGLPPRVEDRAEAEGR